MSTSSRPDAQQTVAAGLLFHAVVPAAGRGERFGGATPKQFLAVSGRPLLAWTLDRLLAAGAESIVVALAEEEIAPAQGRWAHLSKVRFVLGGATRQASVAVALAASPARTTDLVAVHDGARSAVDPADVRATVAAAATADGAVLGRGATDTIKEVVGGRIRSTVDRRSLFRAETPQVFRRETLERALEAARRDRFVGTDEAALVERLGELDLRAVEARFPNPKVTYPEDLALVAWLLAGAEERRP